MTVEASTTSNKQNSSALTEAQEEMNALREQLKEAEKLVDSLTSSRDNVKGKITELNKQLTKISERITELENLLLEKNEQIVETQAQLKQAQDTADKQYEDMKLRIQYMYENGQFSYAEALMASANLSDFLNSAEYINQIQQCDREKLTEYKQTVADITAFEEQLETEREELQALKEDVEEEKAQVASVMAAREAELADIKDDLDDAEEDAEMIAAEVQTQEEVIAEIIRVMAENASKGDAYGGSFVWPVPASKRITCDYGPRKSPTAGASSDHKGIDIGRPSGYSASEAKNVDIVATAPGKVIISRYSSSAGYWITIDHGGGLTSVYMHNSKLLVKVGDTVSGGQVIAKMGSTGISTGPHLHFGIALNGTYVSPWGYLARP